VASCQVLLSGHFSERTEEYFENSKIGYPRRELDTGAPDNAISMDIIYRYVSLTELLGFWALSILRNCNK
jgi:hypothetical protein